MFYEKLQSLCAKNGVSVTKMRQEIGLATSAPVRWKSTQRKYSKAKDRLATLFRTDIRNIHISDLNAGLIDSAVGAKEGNDFTRPPLLSFSCTASMLCG